LISTLVALAPFVVAGVALLGLGWSAARAGILALVTAAVGALVGPGLEAEGLLGAFAEGSATSARVLFVLFGGLLLYEVLNAGGAVGRLSEFLGRLEPEREGLALLVVVGAGPFFESVTGFGVAVVICAPILLGAGFSPVKAAVLSSWGQCAVPWGALGVGTVIGADLSGVPFGRLSDLSALLSLPLFPIYALAAVLLAGGMDGLRKRGAEAVLLGLVAGSATLLTSLLLVPVLSGAVGGLAAVAVFVVLRWRRMRGLRPRGFPGRAALPYAFLLLLLILTNGPASGPFSGLPPLLQGPGLPLLASCAFAAVLLGLGGARLAEAGRRTAAKWLPTAGAVLTFVLAGQVISSSGAAGVLASGAGALGGFYAVLAPVVGALGGALTGSNAASNALFMPPQVEAARGLGIGEPLVAAVQNVAGSQASMIAPQRTVLAAGAVGLLGREGEVARATLPPVLVSVAVLALLGAVLL